MSSKFASPGVVIAVLALAACSTSPFRKGMPATTTPSPAKPAPGQGPLVESVQEPPAPGMEPVIETPPPPQLPRERPKVAPATLGPASTALVAQAQTQRQRGDFPGATVSLERALRIEPNNPLLWIELGRLRMDQGNFPQAESMGRKALSMAVGDDRSQSLAWALISDSLRARGKNPQAQEASERSKELAQR
jgi:hypothetical protein